MAKSKKSRRARRQEAEKQRQQSQIESTVKAEVRGEVVAKPEAVEPVTPEPIRRKVVDFASEYFYVYTDLRNMFIITLVLFIIMAGLLYVI